MARILCTGNVTLDIINTVAHYPDEDEEMRALNQEYRSGGNVGNTAQILAKLRQDVYLAGVTAKDAEGQWLKNHLREQQVNVDYLMAYPGHTPTSYITLNQENGSRTIVHHRDLPELLIEDFRRISLERIDWFHFEGRNVEALDSMLRSVLERRVDQTISLEMEKDRPALDEVAHHADLLLFSRPYAESKGFSQPQPFITWAQEQYKDSLISLTWGDQGAWGSTPFAPAFHCSPIAVPQVIDSIGAGDTYNAGVINALCCGKNFGEALTEGCRLAEMKLSCNGISDFLS